MAGHLRQARFVLQGGRLNSGLRATSVVSLPLRAESEAGDARGMAGLAPAAPNRLRPRSAHQLRRPPSGRLSPGDTKYDLDMGSKMVVLTTRTGAPPLPPARPLALPPPPAPSSTDSVPYKGASAPAGCRIRATVLLLTHGRRRACGRTERLRSRPRRRPHRLKAEPCSVSYPQNICGLVATDAWKRRTSGRLAAWHGLLERMARASRSSAVPWNH